MTATLKFGQLICASSLVHVIYFESSDFVDPAFAITCKINCYTLSDN